MRGIVTHNVQKLVNADSFEEIDGWLASGGSPHELRQLAAAPVNWPNIHLIRAYIDREASRQAESDFKLREREVRAVEDSAQSARRSAWTAAMAIGISLVSLGLSVAQWLAK